jgi:hypothetical protein
MTQGEFLVQCAVLFLAVCLVVWKVFLWIRCHGRCPKPVIPANANTLKTWREFFQPVFEDRKSYEVRKADRDFKPGQVWYLCEWGPQAGYTGSWVKVRIAYVVHNSPEGPASGIAPGYCVWGFRVLEKWDEKLELHMNERGLII